MPRYWVIAPYENQELFDKVWQFDLPNGSISLGWGSELGDVSTLDRDELAKAVAAKYPEFPLATRSLFVNMIWKFNHDIAIGDIIIARRGRKVLAAIGRVTRLAED